MFNFFCITLTKAIANSLMEKRKKNTGFKSVFAQVSYDALMPHKRLENILAVFSLDST